MRVHKRRCYAWNMNVDEGQTFRNLIVGASNRKAVERIQRSFKARPVLAPLLLLGPSGVGKSHLLQAVTTIGEAVAAVERELLAIELDGASPVPA